MAKMNIPKTSNNSFHNALILLLVIVGNFILYRYVKNIEKDTKILHTYILELNEKMKELSTRPVQPSFEYRAKDTSIKRCEDEVDDDSESIGSQDITNLLKKVMFPDNDDTTDELLNVLHCVDVQNCSMSEEDDTIVIDDVDIVTAHGNDVNVEDVDSVDTSPIQDSQENESDMEIHEETVSTENTPQPDSEYDDDVVLKLSSTTKDYSSFTNDELRKVLKSKGLSTKGIKSELISRITNSE